MLSGKGDTSARKTNAKHSDLLGCHLITLIFLFIRHNIALTTFNLKVLLRMTIAPYFVLHHAYNCTILLVAPYL